MENKNVQSRSACYVVDGGVVCRITATGIDDTKLFDSQHKELI